MVTAQEIIDKVRLKQKYANISPLKMVIASGIESFSKSNAPSTHAIIFETDKADSFKFSHTETNGSLDDSLVIERQFNALLPRNAQALLIVRKDDGGVHTVGFTRELDEQDKALRNLVLELKAYADNYKAVNSVLKAIESRGEYKDPSPSASSISFTETLKSLNREMDILKRAREAKTEREATTANAHKESDEVEAIYKELISYAKRIITSCTIITDLMEMAIEDGFLVNYVSRLKNAQQDIHNAYIGIISNGRLQNAGFFDSRWDCQYKRIDDFSRFLQAWHNLARFTCVGDGDDSAFRVEMCRYIINSAVVALNEAQSLINFCNRFKPFDFGSFNKNIDTEAHEVEASEV